MNLLTPLSLINRPGFPGHFFALLCGAILPFSFAPYDLWPLQLISVGLLFLSLKSLTPKQAMWRGWWFGLGTYAAGVSWVYVSIHIYSHTPAIPAFFMTLFFVAGLAWFFAAMTYCYQKFFAHFTLSFLSFACIWLIFEWSRSWFLTGFPWLFLGDAHINSPLKGFAPLIGVYGIGFLVVLSAAFIFDSAWQKQWKKNLTLLAMPWILGGLLSLMSWTQPVENGDINVVAIQGNIPQERKWLPEEIYPTLEKYRSASEKNWQADLILWPETAITVLHHQAQEYLKFLDEEGQKNSSVLITGIPYQQGQQEAFPGAYHNSILALGQGSGLYHKQRLVPFGEYMPLPQSWRPLLDFFNIPMSEFQPGSATQKKLSANTRGIDYTIAPFICYDIAYPDFVATLARDTGFMVTISNDAWFGTSIGPKQHLGLARMRSLENGRYQLRSTNTGITALIDDKGNIVDKLPQFEYGVLNTQAKIMKGNTPFNIWGSWPVLLLSFGVLVFIRIKKSASAANEPSELRQS